MSNFFEELKRRNVIKSAIAYLVVAWIVIQVAQAVLPTFGAPAWAIQLIIIILAIGLPIWLIISWIYDITPEGIEKTSNDPVKPGSKEIVNKRLNVFLLVSLSMAVLVMGLKLSNVFDSSEKQQSIAVLPFVNMSDDVEQEYFSDGISEEIINMLAKVPGLKVIARTSSFSFKGMNQDVKLIGEQLNVSHILEGSVRKSGNKLRITAQLINVTDGAHMYSEKFDRELEDVFDIQDEISLKILDAIKMKLFGEKKEAVLKNYTENIDAYQLFLKGRYHYNKLTPDDFTKAIEYYKAAIALDSEYAIAYAGLSYCYYDSYYFRWLPTNQSLPLALEAANKAIQLDDQSADGYFALGRIIMWSEWDATNAFKKLEKGIKINPNSVEGNKQLGAWNMFMGNYEEANSYLQKADELDPFSLLNLTYIGGYHIIDGDYEKMREYANRLLSMEPNYAYGHSHLAAVLLFQQQYDEAIAEYEIAMKLTGGQDIGMLSFLGFAYGRNGEKEKALNVLKKLDSFAISKNEIASLYSTVYAGIGEWDKVFEYLDLAIINQDPTILYYKSHTRDIFPEMMNDPRVKKRFELIDKKIK